MFGSELVTTWHCTRSFANNDDVFCILMEKSNFSVVTLKYMDTFFSLFCFPSCFCIKVEKCSRNGEILMELLLNDEFPVWSPQYGLCVHGSCCYPEKSVGHCCWCSMYIEMVVQFFTSDVHNMCWLFKCCTQSSRWQVFSFLSLWGKGVRSVFTM